MVASVAFTSSSAGDESTAIDVSGGDIEAELFVIASDVVKF